MSHSRDHVEPQSRRGARGVVKTPVNHRILLGFDGSASATQALLFADRLAGQLHAQLHVVAVAQPDRVATEVDVRPTIEQARRQCRQALRLARLKLSQRARVRILVGHPARQILRYARAHHIEHIVVGHRHRTLLGYPTISSVARQVAALASCPVTIVPTITAERSRGRRSASRQASTTGGAMIPETGLERVEWPRDALKVHPAIAGVMR